MIKQLKENEFLDLNQFKKLIKIGQGSFGTVYKVEQKDTGIIYAAKISLTPLTEDQKSLNINLQREVNIISQLNHPSVLKFIGYSPINFKQEPNPVIITEYSSNGSLSSILKLESQSLSPQQWDDTKKLINIFGIASAMSYLHSNNIIHRDLKPENILEDDYLFPKIADFGLSKNYHSNKESMSLASTAGLKGTPIYIPPESWKTNEYSKQGDVYAFSLIVYEIMTLDKPFKNFDLPAFYVNVIQNHYRPEFDKPINDCYKKLITCCWSENPEERPTFDDIVSELKNNEGFITDSVSKDEFFDYVDFVENWRSTFDPTKKFNKITVPKKRTIEELEKISSFKNLSKETQDFFKGILEKQSLEQESLIIQPSDATVLFVDDLFSSKDFISVLKYFKSIEVQVKYPLNIFKQFLDVLSKLATTELPALNMRIIASETTKIKNLKKLQSIRHSIVITDAAHAIEKKEFFCFSSLKEITIPSSVKSIEISAFEGCSSLEQVTIPSSVNSIGKRSFYKCTLLKQVVFEIQSSVTLIGESSFSECSLLEQITIPSSVISIGKRSFYKCASLKQVTFEIPSSVASICEGSFSECPSLKQVRIPSYINSIVKQALDGFSSLIKIGAPSFESHHHVIKVQEITTGADFDNEIKNETQKITETETEDNDQKEMIGLLLCGPCESGKTTIMRQLKNRIKNGISKEEKHSYLPTIIGNIIETMQELIFLVERNDKKISSELEEDALAISRMNPFECTFTQQLADKLKALFNDSSIQEAFHHSEDSIIPDHMDYFYSKIDEFVSDDYIPSHNDIIRARVGSISIDEMSLCIDEASVRVFDVGGQKNERKKWNEVADKVSGVVFVVSLADYDRPCFEDSSILRINDALDLFKETVHHKKFHNIPFFFICNKYDAFQKKIKNSDSFIKTFPDFKGDIRDPQSCQNHIVQKFIEASDPQSRGRPIFVYTQSSLDNNQVIENMYQICKYMHS